jgi:cytochrome c-type biogenesis protein CcmE
MSRVDDELAAAVEASEASAEAQPVNGPEAEIARPRPKRSLGLLIGLLVSGGAILALVFTNFKDAAIYSKGVDALLKEQEKYKGRNVRVEGMLVKGTLMRREQPCEYRFKIQKQDAVLPVRYSACVVPDTFRDMPGMDVAVTAEGKLADNGSFEASNIMAKCPSKYEMQERAKKGEAAPHVGTVPAAIDPVSAKQ